MIEGMTNVEWKDQKFRRIVPFETKNWVENPSKGYLSHRRRLDHAGDVSMNHGKGVV